MARHFSEKNIEEFRECFFLNAPSGVLKSADQLTAVMRSLGFSPTKTETKRYFASKAADNRLAFADFLDIMHQHSKHENVQSEVMDAFEGGDAKGRGTISSLELRRILTQFGERLTQREVDSIFREANISAKGQVKYKDLLRLLMSPPPDYDYM